MTNHFSQKLCKQLDEMGLESGSGYFWVEELKSANCNDPMEYVWRCVEKSMTSPMRQENGYPAYTISDILRKGNLIKLFGEDEDDEVDIDCRRDYPYHAHQITDAFMDGDMSAVEEYIINYLEESK